jgi:L-alanine-DL-glutamate epimerase-like enolase superfamily enzyme
LPFSSVAAEDELAGTYKLVSEQRKIVDTGEIVPMPNSVGYISYGKDGRMLVPTRPGLGVSLSDQARTWTRERAEVGAPP